MVRIEVLLSRISKLDEYIEFLYEIREYPREEYLFDPMIYGSSERFLHLSIECLIDIANHIISDMGYRKPSSNKEIFEILFENKIIDSNLKESLSNMAGFRNILVHDYINLDREIVYDILNNNLKDMEDFRNIAMEYVRQ